MDVPTYVEYGVADCGIAGRDVLLETASDVYEPLDLGFGHCRLVVRGEEGRSLRLRPRIHGARGHQVPAGGLRPLPGARALRGGGASRGLGGARARPRPRRLHRGRGGDGPHARGERPRARGGDRLVLGPAHREPRRASMPAARRSAEFLATLRVTSEDWASKAHREDVELRNGGVRAVGPAGFRGRR